ncbi:MAG: hypothetical protein OSJ71_05255 [Acetatifactor sp.]|nr:hypothetical protein [Acetatifactor sp.]
MAKKHRTALQDQREFVSAFYGDDFCGCCGEESEATLEEIESAIADCEMMLQESITRSDKADIAYWRKALQENKVSRRELLGA